MNLNQALNNEIFQVWTYSSETPGRILGYTHWPEWNIGLAQGLWGQTSPWEVLAEAQHSVPYPDTTPLSEFFTAIAMALLEVVSRPDADDRQLRMAGYNALSVAESKNSWQIVLLLLLVSCSTWTYRFGCSN